MVSILDALALVLLGVLAAPGLIIAKRPDAKQIIDKIAPFQGWIGVVIGIWGIVRLLHWFSLFGWLGHGVGFILGWVFYTVYVFLSITLGFLLGIGVIKTFVKNPQARAKMDEVMTRLAPKQGLLGLLAIADGLILLVVSIMPSLLF